MKTKLLLIALIAMIVSAAQAQVKFGIEAGINASKFVGDNDNWSKPSEKGDMKIGFQIGATADYEFKNRMMIMSGLYFTRKVGDLKLGDNYYNSTDKPSTYMKYPKVETKINYLQIPIKIGYNFNISENFSLIPSIGVYAAYGFSAGKCDLDIKGEDSKITSTQWKPLDGYNNNEIQAFRKFDWGATAGVKAIISNHYTVSADYYMGIKKANNTYGLRNSTIQLSVGYRF